MSAVAHPSRLAGPRNGGVPARRAVTRWARRMFRREWRQQLLVVTLLTVAVAAAIGSITLVHNTDASTNSEFGSANTVLEFDGTDPRRLEAGLATAKRSFGTTDVIGHRSVAVPGSVDKVDFRAQDPNGVYGGTLLALHRGRYPDGRGEVAVTDGVAKLLGLELGSTLALGGTRLTVVGIVENPRKLSDEFALVPPSSASAPDHVSVLVDANDESFLSFFHSIDEDRSGFAGMMRIGNDGPSNTLAMFSVATVFLLLASLIAAAGFAVIAQRRLRHLGMLAAIGATQKHVRLVLIANGAIVGALAALCGTVLGLALWFLFAPTLESAVDHRVDRLSLPWLLIALTVLLALFGAIAAAWWPGRTVARLPVTLALSGRPPKPRPARHSAIAAAALIAVGMGCLALANRDNPRPLLIVAGIVATIIGCLLLGPLAIRVFSSLAGRVSIAPRLALRDLVRYQARSGAALAAVTLALGIAATVVIIASAEAAKKAAEPVNLSDRQIRVYLGPPDARELTPTDAPAQLEGLSARVRRLAGQLDAATVIPLRKASQPGVPASVLGNTRVFTSVELARQFDSLEERKVYRSESSLYVATPAVLSYLGIDPGTVDPGTDFLADRSARADAFYIPSMAKRSGALHAVTNVQKIEVGHHLFGSDSARTPPTFVTLNGLRRHGWNQIPAGWLVESSRPLTSEQIADARNVAADAGLTIEVRHGKPSFVKTMAIATGAGALLALAILAMTVGLIRSESAGDLRTLTATGATSGIRRRLTATTAGALAFLGALLGVAGAYVVLSATYYDDLGYLSHVPVMYLVLAVIGVPLAATAAGWLLAGREPRAIARTVIE
jgi:putative ABC transport system permease protein